MHGVSGKKVVDALDSIDIDINDINGILVTHEHLDHIKGIGVLSKKYNIPIFSTEKTWKELNKKFDIKDDKKNVFKLSDGNFFINDLKIIPFKTSHDAIDSCGFSFENDDKKITVATDLGYMEEHIFSHLSKSQFVLLESNYETNLLKMGKYPDFLKSRILGNKGHLSNKDAGKTVASLIKSGIEKITLGHISKENNFPELALQSVNEELLKQKLTLKDIDINVASREKPEKLIRI